MFFNIKNKFVLNKIKSTIIFIITINIFIPSGFTDELNSLIDDAAKRAEESINNIEIHLSDKGKVEAQNAYQRFLESQGAIESEKKRLKESLPQPEEGRGGEQQHPKRENQIPHIYLFISSSMPTSVLREYVEQIDSNGFPVTMVLRGFINGMSCPEPTIEFVREVLSEERECFENCDLKNVGIEIDPLKYAEFQISSVPSFAWYRYDQRQKISGAVPIQYVIDRIK